MTYVSVKHDEIDTIDTMQGRESVVSYTPRPIWQSFVDWCSLRLMLRRSRIQLMDLTDEQLRDIGITRGAAHKEARKVRFHIR
ncbi:MULTISPECIES: DUF1127 domain-containing protein [Ochrobactrum]|jgi:uncharacterized protein YjiS (DUF1127 family)|uniref:DUF1127 domain-containing protein n=1 Tax=Ochrobactrum quorumnocens TaxID=271865 RepID=A0A248UJM0_9HYPH|nr:MULTISPECIES: DUF1127 domain-containing protein [Brucella/Ochrobactrum group]ASV86935.1 hypothetical protein CES85_0899 [[Ochrobactrum] quorumnocens]KAA9357764.1 DUF1127 domain-containing protein [[Ochrobactrum] quorumnocens]MBD7993363.1 DUF1127 domain-containing protein [Ochrobactrum gallinarum]MDH7791744.1 uncharacterized protein YjiS (DUF1127 family) [Ochrobactrum sp. AN78]